MKYILFLAIPWPLNQHLSWSIIFPKGTKGSPIIVFLILYLLVDLVCLVVLLFFENIQRNLSNRLKSNFKIMFYLNKHLKLFNYINFNWIKFCKCLLTFLPNFHISNHKTCLVIWIVQGDTWYWSNLFLPCTFDV